MTKRIKRWGRYAAVIAAALLLAAFAPPAKAAGKGVRSAHGTVTAVTRDHIFVNGKSYPLAGAELLSPEGMRLSPSQLVPGTQADIYLAPTGVLSIVVYHGGLQ